MKKEKGSMVIESMISIFLILVVMSLSLKIVHYQTKSIKEFDISDSMSMALLSVESEIKNNIKFEKLQNKLLSEKIIKIDYDEAFMEKILVNNLLDLPNTKKEHRYIEIEMLNNNENDIKLNILVKYDNYELQEKIIKTRWMDET